MNATIIIIGNEILSGNTLDTNSSYIAKNFQNIGIKITTIITIEDHIETIIDTLKSTISKSDLIITTGGLGPTKDDKTKKAIAEFCGQKLIFDTTIFQHLANYLERRKRQDLLEINREQAMIPKNARVFLNDVGTAPAFSVVFDQKPVFVLPGVPYEVKHLFKDKILPFIQANFNLSAIARRDLILSNIAESVLSILIEDWENQLPEDLSLSYLPNAGGIRLQLTAFGNAKKDLDDKLDREMDKLKPMIGNYLVSYSGESIQKTVIDALMDKKLNLAVAESCTGGTIAQLLTSVSGASKVFAGGVCAYQNRIKTEILNIPEELIQTKNVVSAEVASAMSLSVQQIFATQVSISTTGVAGPLTDNFHNDVGLAFYSIRVNNDEKIGKIYLPHLDREDFIQYLALTTLRELLILLRNNNPN